MDDSLLDGLSENDENGQQKDRKGGDLGLSIIPLSFSIAGLCLTLNNQYRGDRVGMLSAFSTVIAISVIEIGFYASTFCCLNRQPQRTGRVSKFAFGLILSTIVTVLGSIVGFTLLVLALVSEAGVPRSPEAGCADGYGCANIMAIISAIFYGVRAVSLAGMSLTCVFTLIRRTE